MTDKLAVYLQGWLPGWLEEAEDLAGPGVDEIEVLDVLLNAEKPKTGGSAEVAGPRPPTAAAMAARNAAKGLVDRAVEGSAAWPRRSTR